MIYIVAADLEDARQWCAFNGVRRDESVYLGTLRQAEGRTFEVGDRVVWTARAAANPQFHEIEQALCDVPSPRG